MRMSHLYKLIVAGLLFCIPFSIGVFAEVPAIAIIIDDIGDNLNAGKRVINSDWPIAYSILPARPYSTQLARLAHQKDKEVIVHLPMQAEGAMPSDDGALIVGMSEDDFVYTVNTGIDAVPFARGINNHMGSLLTRQSSPMDLLMRTIANRDDYLYFIDSRTTASTVARDTARAYHIPNLERDVFLDTETNDREYVREQVKRLIEISQQQGYALAIGHPYDSTLSILEQELAKLSDQNIQLVSVSKLIEIANTK